MSLVRERFWLWCHPAGSYTGSFGLAGVSHLTPVEAARAMGISNAIMVAFRGQPEPPFDAHVRPLSTLQHLVWSIVGDSSSVRNDRETDLAAVLDMASHYPQISGAIMDDFFHRPDALGSFSRYSVDDIAGFREQLHAAARPLDLWVVLYAHDLDLPVAPHLAACDVVTFWTWTAPELAQQEANLARVKELAPDKRIILGCYMWDFGLGQPMPLAAMEAQCERGLAWLRAGQIDGMIFLASCICDLGLEPVEWTRRWIAQVGAQRL